MHGALIAVTCILGALVWGLYGGKRRRDAIPPEAKKLGLQFKRERNYRIADRFPFLKNTMHGSNCYAFDEIRGTYDGHEVTTFDYHHETAEAEMLHSSFFITILPPESTPSKIALADYQQQQPDINIQLSHDQLILRFEDDLKTEKLEPRLKQLIEILGLIVELKP